MNDFADMGVIILAGLLHATLQLGLGCLLLLYHASLGKHIKRKTRSLVSSYLSGVGFLVLLILSSITLFIYSIFNGPLSLEYLVILISILLALAIVIWFFYYRKGRTTELWLPKVVARFIDKRAKSTNSNTESFALGMLTCFAEAPFTLTLTLIAANSILSLNQTHQLIGIVAYTLISITPMVIMRLAIHSGKTVVDIQRWRVKNKTFLRVVSGFGFVVLALYLLSFKVLA